MNSKAVHPRRLVVVLGDQLDIRSSAFDGFDNDRDAVWMAEVRGESEHVWSHKARIAVFLSAMRHFRDELLEHGLKVHYSELGERGVRSDLKGELERSIRAIRPRELVVVEPGEWRVERDLRSAAVALGVHLDVRTDKHFLCSREEFADHAEGRRNLIMEPFYRWMRKRTGYLLKDGKPEGERWNLDSMNRRTFGREGPGKVRSPRQFRPDETTTQVLSLVEREFPDHPGSLAGFDWPVTRRQARAALRDFIRHRLSGFGEFEDAMWTGEPFLFHSRLSCAMNLKLLDPRAAAEAAIAAWEEGAAPLNSVEGFVRQVIGWREYVRGIYWSQMPQYLEMNELRADLQLPVFYWTGETDMVCLSECIGQTLERGYAHHIQRLMVTGLFAMLLGVLPREVHSWYLAIYVDAVEWVELPNTLGMSQFGDGGIMATKPYAATGKYIDRMSNYCRHCRYDPRVRIGEGACPFTVLYWDFLSRHRRRLSKNVRMALQLKNLDRVPREELGQIRRKAGRLKEVLA